MKKLIKRPEVYKAMQIDISNPEEMMEFLNEWDIEIMFRKKGDSRTCSKGSVKIEGEYYRDGSWIVKKMYTEPYQEKGIHVFPTKEVMNKHFEELEE